MRITIVFIFCLFNINLIFANIDSAYISVDLKNTNSFNITPKYGSFIEFYEAFQNGKNGIWAQEFYNRGFDISNNLGISNYWGGYPTSYPDQGFFKIIDGGYNENGLYFQRITNNTNKTNYGIYQSIHTTPKSGYSFYVYIKGDSTIDDVKLMIFNKNFSSRLWEISLGKPQQYWSKVKTEIPEFDSLGMINVVIQSIGKGNLDLDEASIIPANNINGFRKEYYDLYKEWNPGYLRYPGGWFVDHSGYNWKMGLGNIDKRAIYPKFEIVRMDFGINEYLRFCEELNILPHLVVTYLGGTPIDAASIVEYCNSDTLTKFGKLRKLDGRINPYNVKMWEIGNEIWDDTINYGEGFVPLYEAMKKVDPSISCMISGNIWGGKPFYDKVMKYVKNKCDIYGWHWAQPCVPKEKVNYEDYYYSTIGGSQFTINSIDSLNKWLKSDGIYGKVKQAITEIWSIYLDNSLEWNNDTTKIGASLLNGLWNASQFVAGLKRADNLIILEKTNSVGTYRIEIDSNTDKRVFYKTPTYYTCQMISNHNGYNNIPTSVICDNFSVKQFYGLFAPEDEPYLEVGTTISKDSIFINIINKHLYDTINVLLNFIKNNPNSFGKHYLLWSKDYVDANSIYEPMNITPKEYFWKVNNYFNCLPHSFNIIAIPISELNSVDSISQINNIYIYPNPSLSNKITVFFDAIPLENINIKIFDLMGNELFNKNEFIERSIFNIENLHLSSGIYFIHFIFNKSTITKNFRILN